MWDSDIILRDYDPKWSILYKKEEEQILELLKENVLGIEHIGSTAIPGMLAYPVIDILVGIDSFTEIRMIAKPIKRLKYDVIPRPDLSPRRFYEKKLLNQIGYHLHLCEYKSEDWFNLVLFRDYLKKYPDVADRYAQYKFMLSRKYKNNPIRYHLNKRLFVKEILEIAREEFGNEILL
ncbi:GrpB family protein [Pallidibacillus pasinlerensis]|uniref:GrpB family protein n=1 Tax=Pallidibacillus pasinlerensis TaxID=2703818 RepID=A0ABX0A8G4_9BACI|nr:GrpB family protein [Pallidibacillus pasinlerensis]NCU17755.1 GrpB family protein [Pallidibacillus pasinlerensis]